MKIRHLRRMRNQLTPTGWVLSVIAVVTAVAAIIARGL
jgi:hypothetical protein